MTTSKKKRKGFCERITVLKSVRLSAEEEVRKIMEQFKEQIKREDVARDDILDALVAAITASKILSSLQTIPPQPKNDCFDLPMEMVYVSNGVT